MGPIFIPSTRLTVCIEWSFLISFGILLDFAQVKLGVMCVCALVHRCGMEVQ